MHNAHIHPKTYTATKENTAAEDNTGVVTKLECGEESQPAPSRLALDVNPDAMVSDLHKQLAQQAGVPAGAVCLMFGGAELDQNKALCDCLDRSGQTLQLVPVTRSGKIEFVGHGLDDGNLAVLGVKVEKILCFRSRNGVRLYTCGLERDIGHHCNPLGNICTRTEHTGNSSKLSASECNTG